MRNRKIGLGARRYLYKNTGLFQNMDRLADE